MANTSLLAAFERMWQHVTYALSGKSDISHNHNDTYYTESEIDTKISSVNTSITNITNGTTKVGKATVADSAATATSATSASTATKATQDGNGKVISSTYETKADATSKLTEAKTYTDSAVSDKADVNHNHDSDYDAKGSAETVQDALDAHTDNADIHFTATERTKLSGIEAGAQKNAVTGIKGNSESSYRTGNVNITKANVGLGNVDNTSDANKPVSTAQQTAIDSVLDTAKQYTDTKTSGLASSSSVTSAISSHNSSTSAHSDIRDLIDIVATEAKEYTDELIADEVTARNSAISTAKSSAISTASSDATTKANNALSSAKTYTDSSLATAKTYSDNNLATAKSYTDTKFDAIMGEGASETLDTIGEISEAIQTHRDVTDALNSAIGTKANASDLTSHTSNKSNPHGVTLSQLGVTATKAELNVLDGITATTAELNYVDGVTSNIQTQLNGKADSSHTHDKITSGLGSWAAMYFDDATNKNHWFKPNIDYPTTQLMNLGSDVSRTWDNIYAGQGMYVGGTAVSLNGHTHTVSNISDLTATATELNYCDGVTSNIQTQLGNKVEWTSGQYATLSDFITNVETHSPTGLCFMGRWKDTGGWCATGTSGTWYRGFCMLQNASSSGSNVSGFILCQHANGGTETTYIGYVTGSTSPTVSWQKIPTVTIGSGWNNTTNQQLYIAASSEANYRAFLGVRNSAWTFCPSVSKNLQLGNASYLWGNIFSSSTIISTSDRNVKKDIQPLTEQHLKFFTKLQPVSFKFIDGTSGRTHIGFISQDVEEIMAECGLTDLDFAGFCKDPKYEEVTLEDGTVEGKVIEGEYIYSLRYEEFIALVTQATQYALKKIETLEERMSKFEERLALIEN